MLLIIIVIIIRNRISLIVSVYDVTSVRTKKIRDITLNILHEIYDEANSIVSSALSKHKKNPQIS